MLQIKPADNKNQNSTHTHTHIHMHTLARIDGYFRNRILQIGMKPTANAWYRMKKIWNGLKKTCRMD